MTYRILLSVITVIVCSACATTDKTFEDQTKTTPPTTSAGFAKDVIKLMSSKPATCDEAALNSRTIKWTCAPFSQGYESFVQSWEDLSNSANFKSTYPISALTPWMYFLENDTIDFYAKGYQLGNSKILIAHDPSEKGREIFIGIGPSTLQIMVNSDGLLENATLREAKPGKNHLKSSYNCVDFASKDEAHKFFIANGYNAQFDPFNLDADGNGIPCESTGSVASDSSQCPIGKSWVAPHTRSNGSQVKGHCRKRR